MNYIEEVDLVSRDSKGKLRVICTAYRWDDEKHGFIINRSTGTYDGKRIEQPEILITKGKANRTVTEQVKLEFNSIIKKYKDKGYKELDYPIDYYTEESLNNIVGENVTNQFGVLKPMLAKQEDKVTNRNIFNNEWYGSRKIDGTRCIIYLGEDGEVHTASRGGETYDYSTSHIRKHPKLVNFLQEHPHFILDGELYKHGKSLQQISGAARLEKNAYDCKWLEYYIYDIVNPNMIFSERLEELEYIKDNLELSFNPNRNWNEGDLQIQIVPQVIVKGWDNMVNLSNQYVDEGFEGLVIRDPSKLYKPNGRTNAMIKIKNYKSSDFNVVGYELGLRGSEDMTFICELEDGRTFKAMPIGDRETKAEYVENFEEKYLGHKVECTFFNYSDEGIPTQPKARIFRFDLE